MSHATTIIRSLGVCLLAAALSVSPTVRAVEIQILHASAHPGGIGTTAIDFLHVGTNQISSFELYISNSVPIGLPTVSPGPDQTNLDVFVDDFGNGVYRVTGLILGGAYITNGRVATLSFQMPETIFPSVFPLVVTTTSPANAVPAPNPEVFAPKPGLIVPSTGDDGSLDFYLPFVPRPFTSLYVLGNGELRFSFSGTNGVAYSVQATTNLVNWAGIGSATETSPGVFEFTDPQSVTNRYRFYRLIGP